MLRFSSCVSMFFCFISIAVASANSQAAEPSNRLTVAERRAGWKLLFDGQSKNGWRGYQKESISDGWIVRDGALVREAKGAGDIVTKEKYRFFEMSVEYRISAGGNSGLMFHVTEDSAQPWHSGPEVQIQDNEHGRDPQKAGWLYQLYEPVKPDWAIQFEKQVGFKGIEVDDATRPAGQWNQLYLRVSPLQSEVAINGVSYYYFQKGDEDWDQRVADSKFARFPGFGKADSGHICLQDHGDEVAFRNIKIRPIADDGSVPDPIDGYLSLQGVEAFPNLKWAGWEGVTADGLTKELRPLVLTHSGDGTNRIFVASQIGMVHVFDNRSDAKQASMFLDIRDRTHDWKTDNEEGLLGFAFHPKYRSNGQFYVYYSPERDLRVCYVSRFRVSENDPNRADPASEEVVLRIPQPFANHNGGSIAFGHDGYLYIALGDGGGRNDPVQHGQDLSSWMGSLLRIDVDRREGDRNYAIPPDNPFRDHAEARPEIFAFGFRNTWRISVDRKTGAIWSADVGQDLWEEINIVRAGGNYGWSRREGTHAFGNQDKAGPGMPIDPVWAYDHQVGKSITGGFVYRGTRLAELAGSYLYADYVSGKIWALKYDEQSGEVVQNMGIRSSGLPVFSFGEDEQGEVYYLIATPTGRTIFRFERT
jgi:glucose/arabinose dehydrogenase